MKRFATLVVLLLSFHVGFSQHNLSLSNYTRGEVIRSPFDDFAYQYNHIISVDPDNPSRLMVTFVFINGNFHTAISYRQEVLNRHAITWLNQENGHFTKDGFVDILTAYVPPNHIIKWKYHFEDKTSKNNTVVVDKASLLILTDDFEIEKKTFEKDTFKLK